MKKIWCFVVAGMLMAFSGLYGQNRPMIGKTAPDFSLNDLGGNTVKLSGLRGNFVVVHFAASW